MHNINSPVSRKSFIQAILQQTFQNGWACAMDQAYLIHLICQWLMVTVTDSFSCLTVQLSLSHRGKPVVSDFICEAGKSQEWQQQSHWPWKEAQIEGEHQPT